MMKALFFRGNSKVEVIDYPDPKPGPGEVVVQMSAAGICGSDLLIYRPADPPPFISGHEGAGVVAEIGDGVLNVKVGDRVAIYHHHGCGECTLCRMGLYMQCRNRSGLNWHKDGCDSDYFKVQSDFCMKLPDELTFNDGAIIGCAGGTAYSAVKKMDLSGRNSFVLFGAGPVGLAILMVARVYGVKPIVVDLLKERLDFAGRFGAAELVDASREDTTERIMSLTYGRGADRVMVASGSSAAQADGVRCIAANGRIGFVGMGAKENTIDLDHFIRRQATAVGSYVCPRNDYPEMAEFLVGNNIHFADMVTRTFKLEQAEEAYRLFAEGAVGKFMFAWGN
jgi:threonine dehydrogenase-like Zn-dependent dehydrogenase